MKLCLFILFFFWFSVFLINVVITTKQSTDFESEELRNLTHNRLKLLAPLEDEVEKKIVELERSDKQISSDLREIRTVVKWAESEHMRKALLNSNASHPLNVRIPPIAVVLIACDRLTVSRSLDLLIKYRQTNNRAEQFPIIVSQDCGHKETAKVISSYAAKKQVIHLQHPNTTDIKLPKKENKFKGYYKIARHYKWALNQVFHKYSYKAAIIVEDDLEISPDFFEYFYALYPILVADESLWCISGWNDNGKQNLIEDAPELLHRTDFFPGLGWMLLRDLWEELEPKWPNMFWDDWMRKSDQRKHRSCIRPEVSRTSTFGKKGVSRGLYYEQHLKFINVNRKFYPFSQHDVKYLLKPFYDAKFNESVFSAPAVTLQSVRSGHIANLDPKSPVRLVYNTKSEFQKVAKSLGAMNDFKDGVPRTGYNGVVSFMSKGRRIFLAPSFDWKGYDTSW